MPKNEKLRAVAEYLKRRRRKPAKTDAERQRKRISLLNALTIPPVANPRRRERATASLMAFIRAYCMEADGGIFKTAPQGRMAEIVEKVQASVEDSIWRQLILPRGHGKTTLCEAAAAWALATGRRRFVVIVAAAADNATNIMGDVFRLFVNSVPFAEDFPELAIPLQQIAGAQRSRDYTVGGQLLEMRHTANELQLPKTPGSLSAGSVVVPIGFNGSARGLKRGALRPDMIFFDDLQKDDMAANEQNVLKALRKLQKTFLSMGGHTGKRINALMTATPIEPDDLVFKIAENSAWETTKYPMVISWPSKSAWKAYQEALATAKADGRDVRRAGNRFYREHRAEIEAGAEVLNPHNKFTGELSALQHAMNAYFDIGHEAFMCEYQMAPPRNAFAFEITAQLILQRIRRGVPAKTIPADTVLTVAATDINPGYALTTAVVAFDIHQTAFVTAYHVTPVKISERLNDTAFDARLTAALRAHAREIAAQGLPIDLWGVDAGGKQFPTVTRFTASAEAEFTLRAVAMLGRAGQNWNPNVRSKIRAEKNSTILCRDPQRRRWLAWNADEYKEKMHRAWLTETGGAGGLSLFDGGANHYQFASQIANEKLVGKIPTRSKDGRDTFIYKWQTKNPHDYGDCLAMCFALAGAEGLSEGGETMAKKPTHIAIGGKIIGAAKPAPAPEAATPPGEPAPGETPPPPPKKRRRIAIGGRLI